MLNRTEQQGPRAQTPLWATKVGDRNDHNELQKRWTEEHHYYGMAPSHTNNTPSLQSLPDPAVSSTQGTQKLGIHDKSASSSGGDAARDSTRAETESTGQSERSKELAPSKPIAPPTKHGNKTCYKTAE